MSSEDLKKHIRTQGRYSDPDLMKGRDKKHKISPKEKDEKKVSKRYSNERRKSDEHSSVKYEENSSFQFNELEEQKKPVEISDPGKHILSHTDRGDSLIYYKPDLFDEEEAWDLFNYFESTTMWNSKNIVIRGEEYPQPRLVAWYGPYPYSYSGVTLEAAEMPEGVIIVKQKIEAYLKDQNIEAEFNSVLLNMYRDEKDSVAWHSDDELTMGIRPTIASISLGEVRRFEIRPKKRYNEENPLELSEMYMNLCHGSLVVMDGCMQEDWQHRIPKEYHDKGTRINLTFRTVFPIDESPCLPEKEYPKQYAAATNSSKTTNSGAAIHFDDADFPALGSTVKTNGKLSVPPELCGSDIARNNKNDDKNREEIVCEDKKSEDNSIDSTALISPDDTTEMERPKRDMRERGGFCSRDKRENVTFRRGHNDERISPDDTAEKERPRPRGSDGFYGREKRENVTFRRGHNDERISPDDTAERERPRPREKHGFYSRENVTFRKGHNDERISPDDTAEKERPRPREKDGFYGREKREGVTFQKSRFDDYEPRVRQGDKRNDRFSKNQNNVERGPTKNFNYDGRINKQVDREREERQNENRRPYEFEGRRYRGDENEERRFRRDENEERPPRSRVNDNVIRQNNNVRPEKFSNVQNCDERRGRNSQTRDDERLPSPRRLPYNVRVQRQYVDRKNETRPPMNLPPRYSNKRNPPVYRVEDEPLSEESFDNNKHAREIVKKEHHGSDHNKELSNFTLNVAANEFVPKFQLSVLNYDQMSLEDLVRQNIKLMRYNDLQIYADSLKNRVLEILDEFEPDEKEDLVFLCAITDGSQSTKNQLLISTRMKEIVASNYTNRKNAFEHS